VAQGASRIACDALILNKSTTNTSNTMFDELWSEIADAPGEIFDIPEMQEEPDDSTFASKLNSNIDF
jgi:hypothetical protein